MIKLPDEVWLLILEHAVPPQEDECEQHFPVAARLARVSRAFVRTCRRSLYNRLELPVLFEWVWSDLIQEDEEEAPPKRRVAIVPNGQLEAVLHYPELRPFVKKVQILICARSPWLDSDGNNEINQKYTVAQILDSLPNFESLVVDCDAPTMWEPNRHRLRPYGGFDQIPEDNADEGVVRDTLALRLVEQVLDSSTSLAKIKALKIGEGIPDIRTSDHYPKMLLPMLDRCTSLSSVEYTAHLVPLRMREVMDDMLFDVVWRNAPEGALEEVDGLEAQLDEAQGEGQGHEAQPLTFVSSRRRNAERNQPGQGVRNGEGQGRHDEVPLQDQHNAADDPVDEAADPVDAHPNQGVEGDADDEEERATRLFNDRASLLFVSSYQACYKGAGVAWLRRAARDIARDFEQALQMRPFDVWSRNMLPTSFFHMTRIKTILFQVPMIEGLSQNASFKDSLNFLEHVYRADTVGLSFTQLPHAELVALFDTNILQRVIPSMPWRISLLTLQIETTINADEFFDTLFDLVIRRHHLWMICVCFKPSQAPSEQEQESFARHKKRFIRSGRVLEIDLMPLSNDGATEV